MILKGKPKSQGEKEEGNFSKLSMLASPSELKHSL